LYNEDFNYDIKNQDRKLTNDENKTIKVFLAETYYLVPGDTFQLFYRSIIQAVNPYGYYIKLTGKVGHAYNRYFEWTPENADNGKTYELQIDICNDNGKIYGSGITKLIVSSPTKASPKNILCIGDSLTANGFWVSYGSNKYKNANGTDINLIGTSKGGYQSNIANYEGHVGWQWSSYLNTTDGPFGSLTGSKISFLDYCNRNSFSGIDELYILMTYNGVGGSFRTFSMDKEPFISAKKLIDQFHFDYPKGKVTLLGIPQPSVNGGLGAYYTLDKEYGDNYGQFVTVLNYNKQLEMFTKLPDYNLFMRYMDVKGQFDSENNMPSVLKPVNLQSSITEPVGTAMGIHPNTNGYLQIGDVFYRALCKDWD
jgi:hypothetical protein